jgi:predicted nucleic acid-binding protein
VTVAERKLALVCFDAMREDEWLQLHPLNSSVVERAAGLLRSCHPDVALRSLDAIHLASALIHSRGPLCTTDGKLRAAAQRIGIPCFPDQLSEIVKN